MHIALYMELHDPEAAVMHPTCIYLIHIISEQQRSLSMSFAHIVNVALFTFYNIHIASYTHNIILNFFLFMARLCILEWKVEALENSSGNFALEYAEYTNSIQPSVNYKRFEWVMDRKAVNGEMGITAIYIFFVSIGNRRLIDYSWRYRKLPIWGIKLFREWWKFNIYLLFLELLRQYLLLRN